MRKFLKKRIESYKMRKETLKRVMMMKDETGIYLIKSSIGQDDDGWPLMTIDLSIEPKKLRSFIKSHFEDNQN